MKASGPRTQIWDREPIKINWKTTCMSIACCDCGLTHNYYFKVKGSVIEVAVEQDRRATQNIRRHLKNYRIKQLREGIHDRDKKRKKKSH